MPSQSKGHNVALQRPGHNCMVRQVVDKRHADSGPLQALVGRMTAIKDVTKTQSFTATNVTRLEE